MAGDGSQLEERGALLMERYLAVRQRSERLCKPLEPEDFGVQSMADASPARWHLAHTSWFFETFVLREVEADHRPHDPSFGFLFNSYYEAEGERQERASRGRQTRPTTAAVFSYRRAVDERIARVLQAGALSSRALEVLEVGLHHEEQHQELLLTDLQHLFGHNVIETRYAPRAPARSGAAQAGFRPHAGGLYAVGHPGGGFCYDNEAPRHQVYLEPFEIAEGLVSNAEYAGFVEDGGYARPDLWLSDGWAVAQECRWQAPLYWRKTGAFFERYSLHGVWELDPSAPVAHVSYYEADAYARWAGARLPREAEWEVASALSKGKPQFLDEQTFVPLSLGHLLGSAWVWTASPYGPYPGYRPPAGALGEYNGKFMCNQLVLRGGSCFSPPGHVRASYRNFFYPDARWQVTGIRLAR